MIKGIPLALNSNEDKLIWHYSSSRICFVNLGYHLAITFYINKDMNLMSCNSSSSQVNSMWKKLWKLNIPNKIEIFLWKATYWHTVLPHNWLPQPVDWIKVNFNGVVFLDPKAAGCFNISGKDHLFVRLWVHMMGVADVLALL
ncbi:hypothetical protein ACH5RR_002757 [Cinchona calisaya]|uniref:Reverse transcriptase zinc-binding domain-containing protein n=1 Tax=Cinchona calisaya TaxID=153742 RepID=A0ABD3ASY0_9GENT